MLSEFPPKHASNNPVTFVAHKRFALRFFLPSSTINTQGRTSLVQLFFFVLTTFDIIRDLY